MTHLTLKFEQLCVKLNGIYALNLFAKDEYQKQLGEALFARPVLHMNLNLYNDNELHIKSKAYCSIKSNAFQNFARINSLTLNLGNIVKIEANSFSELSNLKKFHLTFYSKSLVIDTNALNGLENLENLAIQAQLPRFDLLATFEGLSFANFKNLKCLKLDGIALASISDHFFSKAQQLESIRLSSNKLNSISIYSLQGLTKLQRIVIDENEIETLNLQSFANLPCLKELHFSCNLINRFENKREDGMSQGEDFFPKLEEIDLSHNRITHFMPDTFIQFGRLITLNLTGNKLTEIQISTLRGLHQIRTLNVSHNLIETIEAGSFNESPKLKEIYLNHNKLTTLDASLFCKLCHLETLKVEGNNLDKKSEEMLSELQIRRNFYDF